MKWEETQHGRAAAGDATVREGRHGAGAVPPCCWNVPTHSWVRIGEINYGKGRENTLGFQRLALHSKHVTFVGLDGKEHVVVAPYPKDFEVALEALQRQ